MSANYTCDKCNKNFRQKKDFTDHKKRKTPCISLEAMQQIADNTTNEILQLETRGDIIREGQRILNKNKIINIFKSCLNILRDSEGLAGEKALRNLSYLLTLKLIEPQIGTQIDIDNYQFNAIIKYSPDEDDTEEESSNKPIKLSLFRQLIPLVKYSNLKNVADVDLENSIKKLWDDILSEYPSTKNIFLKDKKFDIKKTSTFRDLFNKLNEMDTNISNNDFDILGASYEEVIKDIMVGKVLGQYFTQPLIKKLMVELLNPQLREDGTFDNIADPTMGTGGFLISYLNEMIKQSKELNITLNTEFIKSAIYGKEIEPDTYQLAVSNMLISSGLMLDSLECGDSIRTPITRKFDNILANPPFGIKGLKYNGFDFIGKDEYVPIKSDSAVSLFIQAIIHMLKIEGKCAIVLPDGKDLFSKSNHVLVMIREYLLKTCDLQEVIYMPNNSFTNTGVKTCVFFFIKKKEGTEVITINSRRARGTNRELKREYIFNSEYTTESVKFYNSEVVKLHGENKLEKTLLIEVPISDIARNSYSLNYAEYMESNNVEYSNEIEIKSLGELFNDISTNKNIASSNRIDGNYRFFTCSREESTHNKYYYDGSYLIRGSRGTITESLFITNNEKFAIGTSMFVSEIANKEKHLIKYIYYYLKINNSIVNDLVCGSAIPMINKLNYYGIQIPIPSLGRQNEIVEYLDFIHKSIDTSNQKIAELKQLNAYYLNHQAKFGRNEIKKLGEVCKDIKTGRDVIASDRTAGIYPFYGANGIIDHVDGYLFDGKYLLTARTGSLGSLHISNGKFWCSGDVHRIEFDDNTTLLYVYYYLQTIDFQKFRTGAVFPKLSGSSLKSINIPIPELTCQAEIVSHCEKNDLLIAQLESEIESNKIAAKEFLTMVLSAIDNHLED
jgi:type I restriction-modification system DNA methylase subunit